MDKDLSFGECVPVDFPREWACASGFWGVVKEVSYRQGQLGFELASGLMPPSGWHSTEKWRKWHWYPREEWPKLKTVWLDVHCISDGGRDVWVWRITNGSHRLANCIARSTKKTWTVYNNAKANARAYAETQGWVPIN